MELDLSDLDEGQLDQLEQGDLSSLNENQLARIESHYGITPEPVRRRESGLRAFSTGLIDEAAFGIPEAMTGGEFVPTHKSFGAQTAEGAGRVAGFALGGPTKLGAKVASKVGPRLGAKLFGRMATGAISNAAAIAPTALTSPDELGNRALAIPFGAVAGGLAPAAKAAKGAFPFLGKARGATAFEGELGKMGASATPVSSQAFSGSMKEVTTKPHAAWNVIDQYAKGYAAQFGRSNPLDKLSSGQILNVRDAIDLRNILDFSAKAMGKEAGTFLPTKGAASKRAAAFHLEGIRSIIADAIGQAEPKAVELLKNYGVAKKAEGFVKSGFGATTAVKKLFGK